MAKLKLYVMKIGQINLPDKGHMTPGSGVGQPISMPAYCYLIEHEKGIVLVDTGEENGGPAVASEEEYCYNQIEKIGYKPDDIDYVVMTHLHVDHAAFMNKFPNSTFIVRNEELKVAWWPEKCEKGYVYDHYRDTRDFDFIQPCDDEEYDVFGDGTVVLVDTKGHTRGHQSVIVNLENSGKFVLASDAASLEENLEAKIQPGYCSNPWFAMRSLDKLENYKRAGYKILFGHDVEQEKELKIFPEYYD